MSEQASTSTTPAAPRRCSGGINVPLAYTTAYTVFGLGCVVASHIPNNAGSLEPLTVSAPADTILNAQKPLAVRSPATCSARCCRTWCSAACAR
ncbi:MAG: hydantoinase B/oxoprolinase family protein [Acetobacteraceae bacterium]